MKKKVQAFWRCETKAMGVVVYAMEVYMRSVVWDTNLLPYCFGAVDCAVVMVPVEAKRRENERTTVIEKTSKARDELKKIYTGKIKMPFWLHESGLVEQERACRVRFANA